MNDRTSTKGSRGFSKKKSKVENCGFGPKLSESDQSLSKKQVKIHGCISCKCLSEIMFNGVMVKSFHFYWMHPYKIRNCKHLKGSDQGIKPRRCGCRNRDFIEINGPEKIVPKNCAKVNLEGQLSMFVKKDPLLCKNV